MSHSNSSVPEIWTNSIVSIQDSTKTVPVTMKMDPKGFYVYWVNQSKVITIEIRKGGVGKMLNDWIPFGGKWKLISIFPALENCNPVA